MRTGLLPGDTHVKYRLPAKVVLQNACYPVSHRRRPGSWRCISPLLYPNLPDIKLKSFLKPATRMMSMRIVTLHALFARYLDYPMKRLLGEFLDQFVPPIRFRRVGILEVDLRCRERCGDTLPRRVGHVDGL